MGAQDFIDGNQKARDFQKIVDAVSADGNIVVGGCNAINSRIGHYVNTIGQNFFVGGDFQNRYEDVNVTFQTLPTFNMNAPLSKNPKVGWTNFGITMSINKVFLYHLKVTLLH